jgi:hypothetical protein
MGFRLPDLIVESVIRDGLQNIRQDTTIVDDVFEDLSQTWLSKKYGQKELNRIKDFCRNTEIKFVQAFAQVPVSMPCVSLQLLGDDEDRQLTHLDDFEEDVQRTLTKPEDIAARLILDNISVDSYDPLTGILTLDSSTDLENVNRNQLFVDADGNTFRISGVEDSGKMLIIPAQQDPSILGPCQVRSSIDYEQFEIRGTGDQVKLLLGVHTQDHLLAIYLYTIVKYILKSRTLDLVRRGFQLPTFSGSDFSRNNSYTEPVFERFMTVGGMVQDTWNSDKVVPIEDVEITTTVQRATATNEQLGLDEQTVQVENSSEQDDE